MTTFPTLSYAQSEEDIVQQLITLPLPETADSIAVADACAAMVCALVETDDADKRSALCQRLLEALGQLRERCDTGLAPHLIEQLIAGERTTSCVPDCWQETATQVEYAQALTQAILGGTLPANVANELTRLLHDMVWLLAEFVREPAVTAH
ncbi:hypothetical protein [Lelliottia sp. CFBP8978]|jgi:hypothetical protein|uniref:hypothetical protein n=1 Tax=Lelliottia sp. CFBP8978 TaxID=3096522 RepID=UPI002A6A5C29|nr:hypothetical protein [Lelliottia sp. CFBP8978]MDY1036645.1 hypothetical protein [Lelliottia sp. CFBP8978]